MSQAAFNVAWLVAQGATMKRAAAINRISYTTASERLKAARRALGIHDHVRGGHGILKLRAAMERAGLL